MKKKIARLEAELETVKETLRAIQSGEVDALVVTGANGEQIYTLQSADRPYRILVETMSEGAVTLNHEGMIFYCNQRFSEMLRVPMEHLIGSAITDFISIGELPGFSQIFELGKRGRSKMNLSLRSGVGHAVPVYLSMSAVDLEGAQGVCLIVTDMSEQRRFEASRADVDRLNIEKNLRESFVSTLSHDLRNPLAAAKINTQMMLRHVQPESRVALSGNKILKNINRADMMIQDLLDANQIRAGERLPLQVQKCDLREITEELFEDLVAVHGDRFILKAPKPVSGVWSNNQLRRVVENLANNAIKYGGEQTPVTIKLSVDAKKASIIVHNQGSYLTPEERASLFMPYARTSGAIASGKRGWGLGLTLVRGVVEAHGGKVSVESSLERGTSFIVTLPKKTTIISK